MKEHILSNLANVRENIRRAAIDSGRAPEAVTLIAVSKTRTIEEMEILRAAGVTHFGENRVQEYLQKQTFFEKNTQFHLIGHLQNNKIKYIIESVQLIHSVDTLKLALELDKQAARVGRVVDILLEINVAGESTKFGFSVEEAKAAAKAVAKLENLRLCGLMTVAPDVANPEDNRKIFKNLRFLSVDITDSLGDSIYMNILSMGMTNDYAVAVSEGATHVRVGTGLFGARPL